MRRRRFLAAVGTLAGLAGCLDDRSTGGSTPSTADSDAEGGAEPNTNSSIEPTTTAPPTPGDPVSDVVFHAAYRHVVNVDGIAVKTPERDQFVFVSPPSGIGEPPVSDFTLEVGDQPFEPESFEHRYHEWTPGIEGVYRDDERTGFVPFDVSTVDARRAALVVGDSRHPLPEESVSAFASAPDLVLESVSVPETAPANDAVELGIEVRNDGDAEGTYLAGFRIGGMPERIDVPVEPGERNIGSVEYETRRQGSEMTFLFRSPDGDDSYTVDVEPEE